jgi:hypothetical protein
VIEAATADFSEESTNAYFSSQRSKGAP